MLYSLCNFADFKILLCFLMFFFFLFFLIMYSAVILLGIALYKCCVIIITRHDCVIAMTRILPAYAVTPSDSMVT